MPSAQSCEPVRKTVNSLVLGVLPGHIYLLVNSQGNMQSEEKHQGRLGGSERIKAQDWGRKAQPARWRNKGFIQSNMAFV